jgi:HEAT repeat protein
MKTLAGLLACLFVTSAHSAELELPRDGWVSWEVAATENAPAWCCWGSGQTGHAPPTTCRLDHREGFGIGGGHRDATTDTVKVYAHLAAGKVERLQVLAASCPVETRTPVQALAAVAADDSARWLIDRIRQDGAARRSIGEDALAALAMHRGELAGDALSNFARNDTHEDTRKSAIFWLAVLRGAEGADITSSMMFNDASAEVRKHAAFAMAQTRSPRAAPDLIRQGNTDKVGDVRAQAWFWLAQTGAAEAERAIAAALRKDADDHVREQAIFALSQLPEDRSTRALVAAAEDRSLSREQRKRAVFWLAQSESVSAQAYLEKVLAHSAGN